MNKYPSATIMPAHLTETRIAHAVQFAADLSALGYAAGVPDFKGAVENERYWDMPGPTVPTAGHWQYSVRRQIDPSGLLLFLNEYDEALLVGGTEAYRIKRSVSPLALKVAQSAVRCNVHTALMYDRPVGSGALPSPYMTRIRNVNQLDLPSLRGDRAELLARLIPQRRAPITTKEEGEQ